jgi:hypothetical protein
MSTEEKKQLLTNIRAALDALDRLPTDRNELPFHNAQNAETLRLDILDSVCGLTILSAQLTAEIGTDNL